MNSLHGWLPIRIDWRGSEPCVHWCRAGAERLDDPFFDHAIGRLLRRPFPLLFQRRTGIDALLGFARELPPPRGLVLHMSRCGSTLVSQLLAASPSHVVVSEASVVDTLLRPDARIPDDERAGWLAALLAVLGHARDRGHTHAFVKLEAWHTTSLPLLRRALPDVPWVFVYRDPVEVLVSLADLPGGRLLPGAIEPAALGLELQQVVAMPAEEYHARVLARICAVACEHHEPGRAHLVEYRALPRAVWEELPAVLGFACDDADVAAMQARARLDAKQPERQFRDNAATRQANASAAIRDAARRFVAPHHEALERLRARQTRGRVS